MPRLLYSQRSRGTLLRLIAVLIATLLGYLSKLLHGQVFSEINYTFQMYYLMVRLLCDLVEMNRRHSGFVINFSTGSRFHPSEDYMLSEESLTTVMFCCH